MIVVGNMQNLSNKRMNNEKKKAKEKKQNKFQ